MAYKINKETGKIGEYYPIDISNREPIFDMNVSIERSGVYFFKDGELILVVGEQVYVYNEKAKSL